MMDGWGTPSWGPGFGIVFMFVFWGLVIVGIVAIVKWIAHTTSGGVNSKPRTARQILDERYARGDIGRDEYEQIKRDIEQKM